MQHDWSLHYWERIATATEATAATSARTRREVAKVRGEVRELITWIKRLVLLASLWGSGLGLHLTSEQAAELLLSFLKR